MVEKLPLPSQRPISEGMQHGPFPPPELDYEPSSAQWIMDEAGGDMHLYQLLMLRESLIEDKANNQIDHDIYERNMQRLDGVIKRAPHLPQISKGREVYMESRRRRLQELREQSDPS
jgi:hypothetical protein